MTGISYGQLSRGGHGLNRENVNPRSSSLTEDLRDHAIPRLSEIRITELHEAVEDRLFKLGMREGVPFLDFARETPSLLEAVASAISDVENSELTVKVIRARSSLATGLSPTSS